MTDPPKAAECNTEAEATAGMCTAEWSNRIFLILECLLKINLSKRSKKH